MDRKIAIFLCVVLFADLVDSACVNYDTDFILTNDYLHIRKGGPARLTAQFCPVQEFGDGTYNCSRGFTGFFQIVSNNSNLSYDYESIGGSNVCDFVLGTFSNWSNVTPSPSGEGIVFNISYPDQIETYIYNEPNSAMTNVTSTSHILRCEITNSLLSAPAVCNGPSTGKGYWDPNAAGHHSFFSSYIYTTGPPTESLVWGEDNSTQFATVKYLYIYDGYFADYDERNISITCFNGSTISIVYGGIINFTFCYDGQSYRDRYYIKYGPPDNPTQFIYAPDNNASDNETNDVLEFPTDIMDPPPNPYNPVERRFIGCVNDSFGYEVCWPTEWPINLYPIPEENMTADEWTGDTGGVSGQIAARPCFALLRDLKILQGILCAYEQAFGTTQ